jgi:hypothetical protein
MGSATIPSRVETSVSSFSIRTLSTRDSCSGLKQRSVIRVRIGKSATSIIRFTATPGGVNVVFSGHDHLYERVKPQHGITYFVAGSGGQLRKGDLVRSDMTAAAFDQDQTFMLVEIDVDELHFETISRSGTTVDAGSIRRTAARAGS